MEGRSRDVGLLGDTGGLDMTLPLLAARCLPVPTGASQREGPALRPLPYETQRVVLDRHIPLPRVRN